MSLHLRLFAATATTVGLLSVESLAADASTPESEALVADVYRIVSAEESLGWVVDHIELEDMYPTLLRSVCRSPAPARALALERLQAEARELGDPRALYAAAGNELDGAAKDALSAERRLRALERALLGAERDCPFWIEIEPGFEGMQTDRNRFTLNVESGGVAILRQTQGDWTLGGGGFGRVLPAYGFGGIFTLLGGAELGGAALLKPGEETTGVTIHYFPALPLIVRIRDVAWHYDVETAAVALFQGDDTNVSYGARVAATVGLSALYTSGFIPWAGVSIAYEYYLESGGRPDAHFIRGGFRAGVSWDP